MSGRNNNSRVYFRKRNSMTIVVIIIVMFVVIRHFYKKGKAKELERIGKDFPPPPECPKCGESYWLLTGTSPNYKSANWQCSYCNKKVTIKRNSNCEKSRRSDRVITKDVQTEVWRRDQGRCVECGSNENIEYDHIIPWSKGGGNTTRNIQLLCQECNRSKSAKEPGTW